MMTRQAARLAPASRLCLLLALAMLTATLFPGALGLLAWDRQAVHEGQLWRLLTAHVAHLGLSHLLLNLLGLALMRALFWQSMRWQLLPGLLLASALGVSFGLFWLTPGLNAYVGLSGVLHGAWAGSALWLLLSAKADAGSVDRLCWALALLLVAGKLLAESLQAASPVASAIGGTVVHESHALGALAGLAWVGCLCAARLLPGPLRMMTAAPRFD